MGRPGGGAVEGRGAGGGGQGGLVARSWQYLCNTLCLFQGNNGKFLVPAAACNGEGKENKGELPPPSSTPTSVRKNRRRSNLFTPSSKKVGQ